jgi:hypothetical protein
MTLFGAGVTPRHRRARGAGLEYLALSPLDDDLGQFDLWESEILRHFR